MNAKMEKEFFGGERWVGGGAAAAIGNEWKRLENNEKKTREKTMKDMDFLATVFQMVLRTLFLMKASTCGPFLHAGSLRKWRPLASDLGKALRQHGQTYGLTPVCVRRCRSRSCRLENDREQNSHSCGRDGYLDCGCWYSSANASSSSLVLIIICFASQ